MARPKKHPTEKRCNPLSTLQQRRLDAQLRHEVAQRYREELKHDAEVRRAQGGPIQPTLSKHGDSVPDDHDLSACLVAYGMPMRCVGVLEENNCERIADARGAAQCGEIMNWNGCDKKTLEQIRAALRRLDIAQEKARREAKRMEFLSIRRIIREHEGAAK